MQYPGIPFEVKYYKREELISIIQHLLAKSRLFAPNYTNCILCRDAMGRRNEDQRRYLSRCYYCAIPKDVITDSISYVDRLAPPCYYAALRLIRYNGKRAHKKLGEGLTENDLTKISDKLEEILTKLLSQKSKIGGNTHG